MVVKQVGVILLLSEVERQAGGAVCKGWQGVYANSLSKRHICHKVYKKRPTLSQEVQLLEKRNKNAGSESHSPH